jgi:hypothetical protein
VIDESSESSGCQSIFLSFHQLRPMPGWPMLTLNVTAEHHSVHYQQKYFLTLQ